MRKIHIDQPDIPYDLKTRKQWVESLFNHKIWTYGEPHEREVLGETIKFQDNYFDELVDQMFVYTDDEEKVNGDKDKNIFPRVWLEAGPIEETDAGPIHSHDYLLDSSGRTLEEAYLDLYSKVITFYNEDGSSKGLEFCSEVISATGEGFCDCCGFYRGEW